MREFRRASDEFRSTIETNLQINEPEPPPAAISTPSVETPDASPLASAEALADSVLDPHAAPVVTATAAAAPADEAYVAQRGARLFHVRDCGWVARIPEAERVYWKKVAEARDAGYANCPVCEPWEPA
jgi:hypothetical protein